MTDPLETVEGDIQKMPLTTRKKMWMCWLKLRAPNTIASLHIRFRSGHYLHLDSISLSKYRIPSQTERQTHFLPWVIYTKGASVYDVRRKGEKSHKQRSSPLATPLSLPPCSSSVQFFYSTSAQAGLQESRRIAGGRERGGRSCKRTTLVTNIPNLRTNTRGFSD